MVYVITQVSYKGLAVTGLLSRRRLPVIAIGEISTLVA